MTDWNGKTIGKIVSKSCKRVRPGERGAWISNERCSYVVEIDGRRYVGRGRGDGMAVNLRQTKGLSGRKGLLRGKDTVRVYFSHTGKTMRVQLTPEVWRKLHELKKTDDTYYATTRNDYLALRPYVREDD